MFKNFTLLLLLFISLPAYTADAENERKEGAQTMSSKYKLVKNTQKSCPTDEDFLSYEKIYGNMHLSIKAFYKRFGNCVKEDIDLFHIYGGAASDLGNATKLIRTYLPDYHA